MVRESGETIDGKNWYRQPLAIVAIAMLGLLLGLATGWQSTSAHAELERSIPAQDALLAAPPENLQFWFTERAATDPSPPTIIVFDENGNRLETVSVTVDPEDDRHVTAVVEGFATGTYTVDWTVLSADDGHTLNGTFGFRIGPGRAPGAATVAGERPAPWAVVLRWATFLGASMAAASALWIAWTSSVDTSDRQRRRAIIGVAGAAVALAATVLEPVLQSRFPPSGVTAPSLSEAIAGLPSAWWVRPAGLALAVGALVALLIVRRESIWRALAGVGAVGGVMALVGLAWTTHVAARETWQAAARASVVLHEVSVGLWTGGLIVLALAWPRSVDAAVGSNGRDDLRLFSRVAFVLAPVGIVTGVINAGLVLPTLNSLWESDWGKVLIVKVAMLVPVMVLAARHHLWLRRHAERIGHALRSTVRLETVLVALVVLGGVILALSAPPSKSTGEVTQIDLAAPLPGNDQTQEAVHLIMSPMRAGLNEIRVDVRPMDPEAAGPVLPVERVRLDLISLDYEAEFRNVELEQDPATGAFVSTGVQLTLNGWWEVDVLVRRAGLEDVVVPFFFLIPDPNINGFDAPKADASSEEAKTLFDQTLALQSSATSLRYTERLASGLGGVAVSERMLFAGSADQPAASFQTTSTIQLLTIGDRTWQRTPGGAWVERTYLPVYPPSEWISTYDGATDFHWGRRVMIGDQPAQVITFYVPENDAQIAAWYAWFIDEATGHLVNEAMVSRLHYMRWRFFDFDQPMSFPDPGAGTMSQASPVASPVASPESTPVPAS